MTPFPMPCSADATQLRQILSFIFQLQSFLSSASSDPSKPPCSCCCASPLFTSPPVRSYTTGRKGQVKYHIRQVHTKEWSWEYQLCEDQKGIWWGCIHPWQMDKHTAKKHPVEWEEEQDAFRQAHPFVCK